MKFFFFKFFLLSALWFSAVTVQAQTLKLEELITALNAPKYPATIFEMVEGKGFERIDKQWLASCDRVIYYQLKEGKPSIFVNPMNCFKLMRSTHYPVGYRNEVELQFQKSSRAEFEEFSAQVKNQCKFLKTQNATESGTNVASTSKVFRHEATGTTLVINDSAPVAFIYLIK